MWTGASERKLSASDRRILMTQWVGEANLKLQGEHYKGFRKNCFTKTGCLITVDGSDDDKIKPEGLPDYKVPAPIPGLGPNEVRPQDSPEPADEPVDDSDLVHPDTTEGDDVDDTIERVDSEDDRDYSYMFVGRGIRALYADGWHVGKIDYYNKKLREFHIRFNESSDDDYIQEKDIDGIEVILI